MAAFGLRAAGADRNDEPGMNAAAFKGLELRGPSFPILQNQ